MFDPQECADAFLALARKMQAYADCVHIHNFHFALHLRQGQVEFATSCFITARFSAHERLTEAMNRPDFKEIHRLSASLSQHPSCHNLNLPRGGINLYIHYNQEQFVLYAVTPSNLCIPFSDDEHQSMHDIAQALTRAHTST